MRNRSGALLLTAIAITGTMALSACSDSSSSSPSPDITTEAPVQSIASAAATTVAAPASSGNTAGLEVELSSTTADANQPVDIIITAPESLKSFEAYVVAPAQDGTLDVISLPVAFDKDLQAQMTVSLDKTTTLRAVVHEEPVPKSGTLPADAPMAGQSSDFTLTVG